MPKALLAGGGTAGHVNPLLATAAALSECGWQVECLGTREGLEHSLIPATGYKMHYVDRLPLPRKPHPDLIKLPFRLRNSVLSVRKLVADFDIAIGFGGYVSTPLYLAVKGKVPLVIHEQNARPGLANRLGARWASAVGTTFPGTPLQARKGTTRIVGLPLRPQIETLRRRIIAEPTSVRRDAAEFFGLDPQRFTLVVTGGSLGALSLNKVMIEAAPKLPNDIQVIHLTGRGKEVLVKDQIRGDNYVVLDYLERMDLALALADAVVCRCGAGTVAELSALAIPALYVPLPIGNGEQRLNAASVVKAGGGIIVEDAQLKAADVIAVVHTLSDPIERKRWSMAAASVAPVNPTQAFIDLIEEVAK